MKNNSPQIHIDKIKKWLSEAHDLSYREEESPGSDLFCKFWIFFDDNRTISISLVYPKSQSNNDYLIIGWRWRLDDTDKKAIYNIKDRVIKQNFVDSLVRMYEEKKFKITIDFDGDCFNNISISKNLQLENITESCFLECLIDLSLAWSFVMDNFDFRRIQMKKTLMR